MICSIRPWTVDLNPGPFLPSAARRFNANRAALVQSRIKALERMATVEVVSMPSRFRGF